MWTPLTCELRSLSAPASHFCFMEAYPWQMPILEALLTSEAMQWFSHGHLRDCLQPEESTMALRASITLSLSISTVTRLNPNAVRPRLLLLNSTSVPAQGSLIRQDTGSVGQCPWKTRINCAVPAYPGPFLIHIAILSHPLVTRGSLAPT